MLKKLNKHKFRISLLFLSLFGLIFIRSFESQLFYDPFLAFFKLEYQNKSLPEFDGISLFFGLFFRYSLNTLVSLGIIYLLFKQLPLVRFAMLLYTIFFVVLIVLFFADSKASDGNGIKNMQQRMRQMRGNFFIQNTEGLTLTFEIPLNSTV